MFLARARRYGSRDDEECVAPCRHLVMVTSRKWAAKGSRRKRLLPGSEFGWNGAQVARGRR